METVRFTVVDPGHYHAALILKDMYPQAAPQVAVYAPLGPELVDFLNRVSLFNARAENPTRWELDIYTGGDFFERMLQERPGNVAVFAGKNRQKIERIVRCIDAGYHVLADKPWIIASADLPKLEQALNGAEDKGLVAYDVMTERYEITSILQKELVNTPEVFGELLKGTPEAPAITARSVHHLMKTVSGLPLRRPTWFFNIEESGEGIADVGTHVVDLVQWTAYPSERLDYRKDVQLLSARRWTTPLSREQFRQVTGEPDFPQHLSKWVRGDRFDYYCNTAVQYTLRGAHVALEILWNWEAPPGAGDMYEATFRGSRASIEIRQGKEENYRPELYVRPAQPQLREEVFAALRKAVSGLERQWPGLEVAVQAERAKIIIPAKYREGHEEHFARVTAAFLGYLKNPKTLPAWEKGNMLLKYYICTRGVELARGS